MGLFSARPVKAKFSTALEAKMCMDKIHAVDRGSLMD